MKPLLPAVADPPHTPEGVPGQRSGMRPSVLWEKLVEQAFRYSDIFRRRCYELNFSHLLIARKGLKFLIEASASHDPQQSSAKNVCLLVCIPLHLVAQLVNNPPAVWKTWVQSLGWEDPLVKGKATHSSSGLKNSMDCIVHGVAKSPTFD